MRKIPQGKVTTYKIIAEELGCKAYMAVGNACSRNPDAPRVPCHRVVNSDGRVGGFRGDTSENNVKKKIRMLESEGIQVKMNRIVDFEEVLFRY